jgi:streptogrisin C
MREFFVMQVTRACQGSSVFHERIDVRNGRKRTRRLAAAASVGALILGIAGLQTVNATADSLADNDHDEYTRMLSGVASSQGLTVEQARRQVVRDGALGRTATRLAAKVDPRTDGGMWIDQASGRLVVAVAGGAAGDAADVKSADLASPDVDVRMVSRSLRQLGAAKAKVDALVKRHQPKQVTWFVDQPRNTVRVEVARDAEVDPGRQAFLRDVAKLRPVVDVYTGGKAPSLSVGIENGDGINGGFSECSAGWWVKDLHPSDLVMTAGHCLAGDGGPTWFRRGLHIGGEVHHNFGPNDWGTIHVDDIAAPRPTTRVNLYDGTHAKIAGFSRAPIGAMVCKSGRTSRKTCGPVTAYDVSFNVGGRLLEGMAAAQLCSENGDSGGPVYQFSPDEEGFVYAQGILSSSNGDCREPANAHTYYTPMDTALVDSGTIFVVTTR